MIEGTNGSLAHTLFEQENAEPERFVLPASFAQQRLWFLDQLLPGSPIYNIRQAVRVSGDLDVVALRCALDALVARHEILRTTFESEGGQPVQVIASVGHIDVPLFDLSALQGQAREAEEQRLIAEEAQRAFDLRHGPLLRCTLLRLAPREHVLLLTVHHIVFDGWSSGVFKGELGELYCAARSGVPASLPPLPIQYADYAVWQREWLQGGILEGQLAYWRRQLEGVAVLDLPTDFPRPAVQTFAGAIEPLRIEAGLTRALVELGRSEGATLFMTLAAGFQALLSRYSGQEDVAIGTPIAGRGRSELEGLIGFFVNTLVLRTDLGGAPSFRALLKRVRGVALGAYAHQDLPFEKIVEELRQNRDLSRNPLFQIMFVLQNTPEVELRLSELEVQGMELGGNTARFDLALSMVEHRDGLEGYLEYNTDLFMPATAARLAAHFGRLLAAAVADPDCPVTHLDLLSSEERRLLLVSWNDTGAQYPAERCLHELFAEQALRAPRALALLSGQRTLGYGELEEHANRLAHTLRRRGVGRGSLVGLSLERSPELVIGLLGILKAGGVYVPLDPGYPAERLAYMMEDADLALVLTEGALAETLPVPAITRLCLDRDAAEIEAQPAVALSEAEGAGPQDLAYVIYTSGSTGRPKGVLIEHRGLTNLAWAQVRAFGLTPQDRVLQFASISFDAAVSEIAMALVAGAALYLPTRAEAAPGPDLLALLERERITVATLSPSVLAALAPQPLPQSLRTLIVAGEACPAAVLQRYGAGRRFFNAYGPTEITVCATIAECDARELQAPPIGRPIANAQVYLLDAQRQPVPVGVAGEIYIGGVGVARGYLNRPELTAERFVPDPFGAAPGARLYRSGDLGRYRPDGQIGFLGRIDNQVKLRGFRIELGEIEALLHQHPRVREAAVVVREDQPGDRRLVAYVVVTGDAALHLAELRQYLRSSLPEYMVPSAFLAVEAFPLTPNGKLDRAALPAPAEDRSALESSYVAARTALEQAVVEVWSEVLGRERVGIHDNFFELGGHSLLATQVMSRLREIFPRELALRVLFDGPTVAELAAHIEAGLGQASDGGVALVGRVHGAEVPASFAQQRLWFIDRLQPNGYTYNIPAALQLSGPLVVEVLESALLQLVRRHEALRTTFRLREAQPMQVIGPAPQSFALEVIDLEELDEGQREAELQRLVDEEGRRPFDLQAGPLLRCRLLRVAAQRHVLLLTMHHIVSDGWSMEVLFRELAEGYRSGLRGEAAVLAPLPIQYADYAVWQREWLQGAVLEQQLEYWRQQLAGVPPVLELPSDHARPAVQSFRGARRQARFSGALTAQLKALSRRHGATLFMALLGAFQVLLHRYSGQEDIVVGTPSAGRNRTELEPLIGFFVNTLALRTSVAGNPSFVELLGRVREAALGAYAHQDLPFERLVEELRPKRTLSHSPLFQVMFALQNMVGPARELEGLQVQGLETEWESAKFDLTLMVHEGEHEELVASLEYNTDLFEAESIERMLGHLHNLLQDIVADPERRIGALQMLSAAERERMLVSWNDTAAPYPAERSIGELFEARVARHPGRPAVVLGEVELSYGELNARANCIAHRLLQAGVRRGDCVGICAERSLELIAGLVGILKAGGAYLPLDPAYPRERLAFMIEDGAVGVVLVQPHLEAALASGAAQRLVLEWSGAELQAQGGVNPPCVCGGSDLAYVIYTSGSTGRPKGVAVPHRAVNRLVCNTDYVQLQEGDRVAHLSNISFDAATFEVWGALLNGASVVVLGQEIVLAPHRLAAALGEGGISATFLTAALFNHLAVQYPGCFERVGTVLFGGEAADPGCVARVMGDRPPRRLVNAYGPTEVTTFALTYCVPGVPAQGEGVPIGRPIRNTEVYVLDRYAQPVPVGVTGELYLGGPGLAQGYVRRAQLTAERFVAHPFSAAPGARLYRTGDLVRWRSDGNIEYLGRIDHQVKLRGFRIELGEIESVLGTHPEVQQSVVLVREDRPGDRRLVAYVVARLSGQELVAKLRAWLKERLPDYMVPAALVVLQRLPLTPNGKVDRAALPAPESGGGGIESLGPRTPTERWLAEVWREVLGVQQLGVEDNFFDIGGHSLLAVQIMERIRQQYGQEIPLAMLFEAGTVAALGRVIDEQRAARPWSPLVTIQGGGSKPPLFCVHPAGGNVLGYADLARHLGPDQPVYGLQAYGVIEGQEPHSSVETMARIYNEALRTVQPHGPYYLFGSSFGGVVVYEMGRMLHAEGEMVGMIAIGDTWPVQGDHIDPRAVALARRSYFLSLGLRDWWQMVGRRLRRRWRNPLPRPDRDVIANRLHQRMNEAHLLAFRRYRPQPYPGRVVLFRSAERVLRVRQFEHYFGSDDMGWGALAQGGVEVHHMPGVHRRMIYGEHAQGFAERLADCLARARAEYGTASPRPSP